ncbi:MAG: GFA family protein [Polyangiaceae bacterium]|nr:GFA family protein [Polyangiaceae bacterium]
MSFVPSTYLALPASGGCQCGAVRYEISEAPVDANYCHCRMCQRALGAPFGAFATVKREHFRFSEGEPAYFASSSVARRGFCGKCGTPLTFEYTASKHISFTIGSFDEPDSITPASHIGCESQVSWLHILDDLPKDTTPFGAGTPTEGMDSYQSKL